MVRSVLIQFQAKVGRKEDFEVALQKLRGKYTDVSAEAAEIQVSQSLS